MARIRTIKPEFFTSEDIVELPPLARLLYIALWCEADKEGRLSWKPKTFKMRYLPADDIDIEELCDALLTRGLVVLYGDGLAYIPTFKDHQHINPREKVSVLPEPTPENTHASPRVSNASVTHREEGRKDIGREGKGKEGSSRVDGASPASEEKPAKKSSAIQKPDDVDEQTWADWLQLRKIKKAPVTETVLKQARSESEKAGIGLEAFLQIWCARGSTGLQADWLKPSELAAKGRRAPGKPSINDFSEGGDDDPFSTMRRTL